MNADAEFIRQLDRHYAGVKELTTRMLQEHSDALGRHFEQILTEYVRTVEGLSKKNRVLLSKLSEAKREIKRLRNEQQERRGSEAS